MLLSVQRGEPLHTTGNVLLVLVALGRVLLSWRDDQLLRVRGVLNEH
jgi:hypothetical protein